MSFRFRPRVEVVEDRTLLSTFLVDTTADSGAGSLRQAILDSDALTGDTNTIDFAIPGQGVQTIAPISPLPAITNAVLIDGFSQPGYAGTPIIELSGSQQDGGDGLTITGPSVTVRGLDINGFSQGAGIHITGTAATGNWVYGVFAGIDPTGTQSDPNYAGVAIDGGASNNLVGTNGDGVSDAAERNVLSGNLFTAVSISGQGTDGDAVAGNYLGTDISGSVALNDATTPLVDSQGNYFGGGVAISGGASDNRIGTDGASVDDAGERNVIAGSNNDAIDIWGGGTDGNIVAGNFIGTDVTGTRALGIAGDGVFLAEGASFNWIGVNPNGGTAVGDEGNLLSGNGYDGVQIASVGTDDNVVAGNRIGTDLTGTTAVANGGQGVEVDGGSVDNTIGGSVLASGNLVSGNHANGVWITGDGATGNLIQGNRIGTVVTGTLALGNAYWGVFLQDAAYNTVGGATGGAGNLISGNDQGGVAIRGIDAVGDVVQGNLIGTDVTGTKGFGNVYSGVYIGDWGNYGDAASEATIGGTAAGAGNVISSNGNWGVWITGFGTTGVVVQGNMIGTDVTGTVALGNSNDGVQIDNGASGNTIGGATAASGNVISGNYQDGVVITGLGTDENQVAGNDVGTDRTGAAIVSNDGPGIDVAAGATNNTIGGSNAGAGNLITDNSGPGVDVTDTSVGNQIAANRIFDNAGEAIDLGNDGVTYNSPSPRQGPNNLQNFPVVVATADGRFLGWLGGSTPDATFRIEFFASTSYGPGGSGAAQDYLGSMEVTTDATGEVNFAVPFAAPAGLPVMTATATDPEGNTSEVSSPLSGGIQAGLETVGLAPGQESLAFSPASGDGIDLQDASAGASEPTWELSLLVSTGTLTLASTAGLVGSGDETGSLLYAGTHSALNAALDGMAYAPPASFQGNATLSVEAEFDGIALLAGQVVVTTRSFIVTTTADSGPGSLRQAILDSNIATGGSNTIDFAIPGTGVQTIAVNSPLPSNTTPVLIDGTTQPGFVGTPLIELSGGPAGGPAELTIAGSDAISIRGLVIDQFAFDPTADEVLVAQVHPQGMTTELSLLDSQGQVLVNSAGLSPSDPDDVVAQQLVSGSYFLKVESTGGAGTYTLTTTVAPTTAAFQPAAPLLVQSTAIVAGDFNGDGHLDLAVTDGASTNFMTGDVSILMGNGDGTFQPEVTYAVGVNPTSIVAGDFNGDGHLDLAVAYAGGQFWWGNVPSGVSVLLGNGDGTFQPQVTYAVGSDPDSIVAGDFNGDGRLDLAVANGGSNTVSLLVGNGDGTFQPQVTYAVGSDPDGLVAGNFSGDGQTDLAVANFGSDDVSVLMGNGNGTFQPPVTYAAGAGPDGIVAADFTGDGRLDLAVADEGNVQAGVTDPGGVIVLLGNGNGTFQPRVSYAAGTEPAAIVAGDFKGDGRTDLAVANIASGDVSVLLGNGDGTFQPQVTYAAGDRPSAVVVGDFNGDGNLDLAVPLNFGISILLGKGDGSFQTQSDTQNAVGLHAAGITSGDFTGDHRLDLAVAGESSNDISILLGNGDGTFQPAVQYPVGSDPVGIVAGDFNGDGRTDLAVADLGSNEVSILLGNGDGTFQPQVTYAVGSGANFIVDGDFMGNGRLDLAVDNEYDDTVSVLLGNGDGTFRSRISYQVGSEPTDLVAGDFTGNGRTDLAVAGYKYNYTTSTFLGEVSVLVSNADGTFEPAVEYPVGDFPESIVAGDFTSNGRLDLSVSDEDGIQMLLGNGDGTFQPVKTVAGNVLGPLVPGDFNDDGRLDLAYLDTYTGEILMFPGNGDGTFRPAVQSALEASVVGQVVAGDFNGDGKLDLAQISVESDSDNVSVRLGNGDGTFVDAGQSDTTPHATPLVADVNGDGTDDVLVVDGSGDILYRQGIPGQPGTFEPPVTVNPGNPSRDIAWLPDTDQGPMLASVDAHDANVSLYAYRVGTFVWAGSLATGQLPAQVIAADLGGTGWDDLVVRNAGDGTLSIYFNVAR